MTDACQLATQPPPRRMPHCEPMVRPLPRTPKAAGLARRYLAECLPELPTELLGVTQLLVTEIVTNALRHGWGPVTLRLLPGQTGLRVEVVDGGVGLPRQRTASEQDTGGRGLQIVDALASDWGVIPAPEGGKTVWFEVTGREAGDPGHPLVDGERPPPSHRTGRHRPSPSASAPSRPRHWRR